MPVLEERTQAPLDRRLFGAEDERTLDDVVVGVLYDASRDDPVVCPVCGVPAFAAKREDLLECRSCGTRLEAEDS